MLHVSFTLHFFFLWLLHDVVTKMKRPRNNEKFVSTTIHYYQKVSWLIIWLLNWSSSFKKLKRTKQIWIYSFFYLAQRPSQNHGFRLPSPRPLWWRVSQSGKTKKKQKTKKKKKQTKNQHLKAPEKSGLLSKKAWLQSQLENVVFSTFYTLLVPVRFKCWIALSTGQITIQRISIRKTKCASPLRYRFIQCRCVICLIHMPSLDKLGQGSAWTGN